MPAFYFINTIKSIFSSIIDPISRSKRRGVYALPCNDCDAVYVGETSRQFQVRLHDHLDSRPNDSAFKKHLIEEKNSYRRGLAVVLHLENVHLSRLALESLESAWLKSLGGSVLNHSAPTKGLVDTLYPSPQTSTWCYCSFLSLPSSPHSSPCNYCFLLDLLFLPFSFSSLCSVSFSVLVGAPELLGLLGWFVSFNFISPLFNVWFASPFSVSFWF